MSQYPRRVLADVEVAWTGWGDTVHVRKGTVIDCPPGSAMEAAYGGASNLEDVSGARGSGEVIDNAWLAN